jgi:hemoglobin
LQKHLAVNKLVSLKPGHFTRWLYLFSKSIDQLKQGSNAELMKARAELIAKSISAAITEQKKSQMTLVLPK